MFTVEELKKREQNRQAHESELLEHFRPFVKGFREHLGKFLEEADEAGIPKVSFDGESRSEAGTVQVSFTIRGMELIAIAPERISLLAIGGPPAAKVFVYYRGDEENTPFCEVTITKRKKQDDYSWKLEWYGKQSGRQLQRRGTLAVDDPGAQAANALIEFSYRLDFAWREKLPLGALLSEDVSRTIGF